jgi:hypothetical protein
MISREVFVLLLHFMLHHGYLSLDHIDFICVVALPAD